jgi:hypothetical protein
MTVITTLDLADELTAELLVIGAATNDSFVVDFVEEEGWTGIEVRRFDGAGHTVRIVPESDNDFGLFHIDSRGALLGQGRLSGSLSSLLCSTVTTFFDRRK